MIMANIALSAGVRTNLLSLQGTASMLTATQERLATGKKVNSALDNPTNFFTAQGLSERATSLTSLQDGINTGIQTVKAANKGLDTITTLLKQAKSIAEQAKTAGNGSASMGVDGSVALSLSKTGLDAAKSTAYDNAVGIRNKTLASAVTSSGLEAGNTLTFETVKDGVTSSYTYTVVATDTYADFINKVNASGVASAKINDNGTISFDAAVASGGTNAFTITGGGSGTAPVAADLGLTAFTTAARTATNSANGQNYASQFADVITAINDAVKDSNYNGINLLAGGTQNKLSVTFDGASKSKIDIDSKDFSASASTMLGGNTTLTGNNSGAVLDSIETALNSVRGQQGEYGNKLAIMQTRLDFSKELSNMLEVGADNLTLADTNKEAANLLALQTRQSLSQSALSLANQTDQAVLQLLR
jgi:flagellin